MTPATLARDGYFVCAWDADVARWAAVAARAGQAVLSKGGERRHGGTWFVGVDALPNAADGSVEGVPLAGSWLDLITPPDTWHPAQLSVVFPGYPQQDVGESDAAHRYRHLRDAAHVDGLLPEGPNRRRHLREPHAFIAGFPLDQTTASPLVVWPESHVIMRDAFAAVFAGHDPAQWGDIDVTDVYQSARRQVFDQCARVEVQAAPGQVIILHRHLLHGVAPWDDGVTADMRMMAYFRPLASAAAWL